MVATIFVICLLILFLNIFSFVLLMFHIDKFKYDIEKMFKAGEVVNKEEIPEVVLRGKELPYNAKWLKTFKHQLHHQCTVDTQYRNGILKIFSHDVEQYFIDHWILRRLKHYDSELIYRYLEDELGIIVKGIDVNKQKTHRTQEFFRRRKRFWSNTKNKAVEVEQDE